MSVIGIDRPPEDRLYLALAERRGYWKAVVAIAAKNAGVQAGTMH